MATKLNVYMATIHMVMVGAKAGVKMLPTPPPIWAAQYNLRNHPYCRKSENYNRRPGCSGNRRKKPLRTSLRI